MKRGEEGGKRFATSAKFFCSRRSWHTRLVSDWSSDVCSSDLEACQPRPWRFSLTEGDGQEHDIPDLVKRDFTAGAPGEKMVGDVTYIPTWQGWLYLATVIDCQDRKSGV